jgi:hypothetical protein
MPSANRAKDERFVRECPECTSVFSVKSSLVVSSAYLASTSGDGRLVALPSIAHLHTLPLVAWMIRARCSASRS